jgi:hypothetical protein
MRFSAVSELDAPAERVWSEVRTTRLFAHVTAPLVAFAPVDPPRLPDAWTAGRFLVAMKLFGAVPLGTQWIVPELVEPDGGQRWTLVDHGVGGLAKRWEHRITVEALPDGRARYTDAVDVGAGVLTPFVWLFARLLFAHRQRRLRALAAGGFRYEPN